MSDFTTGGQPPGGSVGLSWHLSDPHAEDGNGVTTVSADGHAHEGVASPSASSCLDDSGYMSVNTAQGQMFEARMMDMDLLMDEISSTNESDSEWGLSAHGSLTAAQHYFSHEQPTGSSDGPGAVGSDHHTASPPLAAAAMPTTPSTDNTRQLLWGAPAAFTGAVSRTNSTSDGRAPTQPSLSAAFGQLSGDPMAVGAGTHSAWGVADAEAERAWQLLQQLFPGSISLQEAQQSVSSASGSAWRQASPPSAPAAPAAHSPSAAPPATAVSSAHPAPLMTRAPVINAAALPPPPPYAGYGALPLYSQPPPPPFTAAASHRDPMSADSRTTQRHPAVGVPGNRTGSHTEPGLKAPSTTTTVTSSMPMSADTPHAARTAAAPTAEPPSGADLDGSSHQESSSIHLTTLRALLEQYNTVFHPYPTAEELLTLRQQPSRPAVDASVTTIAAESLTDGHPTSSSSEGAAVTASHAASELTIGSFTVTSGDDDTLTTATTGHTAESTPMLSPSVTSTLPSSTVSPSCSSLTQSGSETTDVRRRAHTGTKIFLGGLRFEVVQMGRVAIRWIFERACGVHLDPANVLIHRKSRSGKHHGVSPTGCVSVFVPDENQTVQTMLNMNQRVFCAQDGIYVAPSSQVMRALVTSRQLLDVSAEGKVRGPAHPIVIELANSGSGHQRSARSHAGSEASGVVVAHRLEGGLAGAPSSSSVIATDGGSTPADASPSASGTALDSYSRTSSRRTLPTTSGSLPSTNLHSRSSSQSSTLDLAGLEAGLHHLAQRTNKPGSHIQPSTTAAAAAVATGAVGKEADAHTQPAAHAPAASLPPPPTYAAATTAHHGGTGAIALSGTGASVAFDAGLTSSAASSAVLQRTPASDVSFFPHLASASAISQSSSQAALQAIFANTSPHTAPPPPFPGHASVASRSTNSASQASAAAAIPGLLFHTYPGDGRVEREQEQLRRGSTPRLQQSTPPVTPPSSHHGETESVSSAGAPDARTATTAVSNSTASHSPTANAEGGGGGVALFLGGLAVGATSAYTVWLLSRLGVTVHLTDITVLPAAAAAMGPGSTVGLSQPSAIVVVSSERDAESVLQQSKRLLCVPRGCYMVAHPPSASVRTTPHDATTSRPDASSASAVAARTTAQTPLAIQTLLESDSELGKLSVFTAARRQTLPGGTRPPFPTAPTSHGAHSAAATASSASTIPPPPAYGATVTRGQPPAPATERTPDSGPASSAAGRPPPPPGYTAAVRANVNNVGNGSRATPPALPPPPQYYAATSGGLPGQGYTLPPPPPAAPPHTLHRSTAAAPPGVVGYPTLPPPPSMVAGGLSGLGTSVTPPGGVMPSTHASAGSVPQTMLLFGQPYQLAPGTSIQFIPVITTTNPANTAPHAGQLAAPPRTPPQQPFRQ